MEEVLYSDSNVKSDERIVRFILFPKDWDKDTDELAEGFVTLRKRKECRVYDMTTLEEKKKQLMKDKHT